LLAGRYALEHIAGHGGMAVVYEAFDTVLERRVAIKYFQSHLMHQAVLVERFRREAVAAAKIDHPNVVAIHDIGADADERPFIVMEYVDGPTVAQLVGAGTMSPERAVALAAGIAQGLGAAHALGFVHRDVKPANVLVSAGDVAKLTDFGLVRADGESAPDGLAAQLTADGGFVGSVRYVAPEQVESGLWSAASDCYALGATLFEMVIGVPPVAGAPVDRSACDADLASMLDRLLQPDPERRAADAIGVADELGELTERLRAQRLQRDGSPGSASVGSASPGSA
jgi:serine/threonine-protein kinase